MSWILSVTNPEKKMPKTMGWKDLEEKTAQKKQQTMWVDNQQHWANTMWWENGQKREETQLLHR